MTEAYEVGITLALQDGVSAGIANIRRDLAALDRAIAATSANLAGLRVEAGASVASTPAPPRVQPPTAAALPGDAPSQSTAARRPNQPDPIVLQPAQPPAPEATEPAARSLTVLQRETTTAPGSPPVPAPQSVAAPASPPPPAATLSAAQLPPRPETASTPTQTFAPSAPPTSPSVPPSAASPPVSVTLPATAPLLPVPARLVAATLPPFVEPRGRSPPPLPGLPITPPQPRTASLAQPPTAPARMPPEPAGPAVQQTHHHSTAFTTLRTTQAGPPPAQPTPATPFAAPPSAAPALAPPPASPPASFAPPPQPQQSMTLQGDIILDGARVGRWMTSTLARQAARPPSGPTGPDPRQTPLWSGQAQGF